LRASCPGDRNLVHVHLIGWKGILIA